MGMHGKKITPQTRCSLAANICLFEALEVERGRKESKRKLITLMLRQRKNLQD